MIMHCLKSLVTLVLFAPLLTIAQFETAVEQYHVVGSRQDYVPIVVAHVQNTKKWYAEARHNYEELETFSFYVGKTFTGKKKLSYTVTPLLGGALGNFNGISTGMNLDLEYRDFFFSLQCQYSISTDQRTSNFFYSWSELAYQPLQWLYVGGSIQHTRLYETKTTFESGFLVGFTFKNVTIPVYAFAPFNRNRYFMLGLVIEWENLYRRK
jgi:hypothetical protein